MKQPRPCWVLGCAVLACFLFGIESQPTVLLKDVDWRTHPPPCIERLQAAVMFSKLIISKYMVWVAAFLLFFGILQILVGLFVFMSDALDIYMLLLNYCAALIVCMTTVIVSGGGLFKPFPDTCEYLAPISSIAISVPIYSLFLLSFSRLYAIMYPFRYVDTFTMRNQIVGCLLSWFIPIIVVAIGAPFLCKSYSVHIHDHFDAAFCVYPSQDIPASSFMKYNETEDKYMNTKGSYPAEQGCIIYMMMYCLFCLILPLIGSIICYSIIVYQLAIIKENREKITASSAGHEAVPLKEDKIDEIKIPVPIQKKSLSMSSLKETFKRQTSMIKEKTKAKVPISVVLQLTLYILAAIPLTLTVVFTTSLLSNSGPDKHMIWVDMTKTRWEKEIKDDEAGNWCVYETDKLGADKMALFIDLLYSVGLLALACTPWAYIKFTKSFEENLWIKPLKKISGKVGLEIRKSIRDKEQHKANVARPRVASTTSGYSTGTASKLSTVSAPRTSHVTSSEGKSHLSAAGPRPSHSSSSGPKQARAPRAPRPTSPRPTSPKPTHLSAEVSTGAQEKTKKQRRVRGRSPTPQPPAQQPSADPVTSV